jgi:hypothetical protein
MGVYSISGGVDMSKQDFIETTIDSVGLADSLQMHLSANFYPPLPGFVKQIFGDAFNMYWAGMIDEEGLEKELSRVYKGGLDRYGFDNYLLD